MHSVMLAIVHETLDSFSLAVATSLPTPLPPTHPPPQYAGPKLVRTFKKQPEMA